MCCTSCLYPLIRDRCGPLGSHQASKKLHSPLPTLLSGSFSCQNVAPHGPASTRVAPQGPHYAQLPKKAKGISAELKSERCVQTHGETIEAAQTRGVLHQSGGERKGRHQSTLWVTELKFAQDQIALKIYGVTPPSVGVYEAGVSSQPPADSRCRKEECRVLITERKSRLPFTDSAVAGCLV